MGEDGARPDKMRVADASRAVGGKSSRIYVENELPDNLSDDDYTSIYHNDAADIERALFYSLPGGSYDQLLVRMLERKASQLIISYGSLKIIEKSS